MSEAWVVTLHDGSSVFPVGVYTTKEKAFYYIGKDCANNNRDVEYFFPQLGDTMTCQVSPSCWYELDQLNVNKPMDY